MDKVKEARKQRNKKLKEWSLAVRTRAGLKCEWCGRSDVRLNAHHIIGKRHEPTRYLLANGICLCPRCHKFMIGGAAHENPLRVFLWLEEHRAKDLKTLIKATKEVCYA